MRRAINSKTGAARILAALLPVVGAAPACAQAGHSDIVLKTAKVDQAPLGARRAGLLCLPAGSVRWHDVATGNRTAIGSMIKEIGEDTLGPGKASGLQIEIVSLSVKSCAKNYGLGDRTSLSGHGKIEIDWTGPALGQKAIHTASKFDFEQEVPGSGAILAIAMRVAFADLKQALTAPPAH